MTVRGAGAWRTKAQGWRELGMFPNCTMGGGVCVAKGHSCTVPGEASGPEVATGRCTLALSQQTQRGSGRGGSWRRAAGSREGTAFHVHATRRRRNRDPSWAAQGQQALGDSRWHSSSPAAAATPPTALAAGIWSSRHHEEQHNWNDVHPIFSKEGLLLLRVLGLLGLLHL